MPDHNTPCAFAQILENDAKNMVDRFERLDKLNNDLTVMARELHDLVLVSRERLEAFQKEAAERAARQDKLLASTDNRVKKLETWRAVVVGGLIVISIFISTIAKPVIDHAFAPAHTVTVQAATK